MPISDALNADGSVKDNARGTFSTQGYRMSYDKTGASVLTASGSGHWSPVGGHPASLNGVVLAIALSGNDIYVGGTFTSAGSDENADYIAKWNAEKWEALGNELKAAVKAIAIQGTNFFVGGEFTDAGVNVQIQSITPGGDGLYAGGLFTPVEGQPAGHLARDDFIASDITDNFGTVPADFELGQNYPNLFNPATNIRYFLGGNGQVDLPSLICWVRK